MKLSQSLNLMSMSFYYDKSLTQLLSSPCRKITHISMYTSIRNKHVDNKLSDSSTFSVPKLPKLCNFKNLRWRNSLPKWGSCPCEFPVVCWVGLTLRCLVDLKAKTLVATRGIVDLGVHTCVTLSFRLLVTILFGMTFMGQNNLGLDKKTSVTPRKSISVNKAKHSWKTTRERISLSQQSKNWFRPQDIRAKCTTCRFPKAPSKQVDFPFIDINFTSAKGYVSSSRWTFSRRFPFVIVFKRKCSLCWRSTPTCFNMCRMKVKVRMKLNSFFTLWKVLCRENRNIAI